MLILLTSFNISCKTTEFLSGTYNTKQKRVSNSLESARLQINGNEFHYKKQNSCSLLTSEGQGEIVRSGKTIELHFVQHNSDFQEIVEIKPHEGSKTDSIELLVVVENQFKGRMDQEDYRYKVTTIKGWNGKIKTREENKNVFNSINRFRFEKSEDPIKVIVEIYNVENDLLIWGRSTVGVKSNESKLIEVKSIPESQVHYYKEGETKKYKLKRNWGGVRMREVSNGSVLRKVR